MLEHFYHQTIRKVVVAFASLFNDIYISRQDNDGNEVERFKVPIAYGSPQKFLARLYRIGTDFDAAKVKIENYIPRMAFGIQSFTYDPGRKLNTMNRTLLYKDRETLKTRYERVPYNLDMNLDIIAKNTEDALQIIEQILPYFQPEYTVTIRMNDMDQKVNVPIVFKSCVLGDDNTTGNYDLRKLVTVTLSFTARIYLYGPIREQGVILDTTVGLRDSLKGGLTAAAINVYPNTGVTAGSYVPAGPTAQTNITEYS